MKNLPAYAYGALMAAGVGVLIGVGAFTFIYAEGQSYFHDDPAACANCHVMDANYESWLNSSHSHVAVCNECHTPERLIPKYFSKADNGFRHAWRFTFDNFDEPIRAIERNQRIIQRRCIGCHADLNHDVIDADNEPYCATCHVDVGHAVERYRPHPFR